MLVGKKIINTGVKIVPNPKPEKKVKTATKKAVMEMMNISMAYRLLQMATK
jgi:hypothetical protein